MRTSRGPGSRRRSCSTARPGWSTLICDMAGVQMPVQTFPLQAAVTEPVRPFLDAVVVSGTLHVYVSQTDRGELVFGASVDPYRVVLDARLAGVRRGPGRARAGADAVAGQAAAAAAVGRAVRHDPGLLADHGPDPGRRLPASTSAGAPTASRPARCPARRWPTAIATGKPPEIIAAVRPGPVRRRAAGRGEGGGGGWPLTHRRMVTDRDAADLPMVRARVTSSGVPYVGERARAARPGSRPRPANGGDYLYFRANTRGWVTESWYHRGRLPAGTSSSSGTRLRSDAGPAGRNRILRRQNLRRRSHLRVRRHRDDVAPGRRSPGRSSTAARR